MKEESTDISLLLARGVFVFFVDGHCDKNNIRQHMDGLTQVLVEMILDCVQKFKSRRNLFVHDFQMLDMLRRG